MRGEGRGEVKGDAVDDFAREKPGGATPKPGGGAMRGEELEGVGARATCQGAGDDRRMIVWRTGGGEADELLAPRKRQSESNTASSRALPVSDVFSRINSSSFSVLSSSSSESSCRTGRQRSYTSSETMAPMRGGVGGADGGRRSGWREGDRGLLRGGAWG